MVSFNQIVVAYSLPPIHTETLQSYSIVVPDNRAYTFSFLDVSFQPDFPYNESICLKNQQQEIRRNRPILCQFILTIDHLLVIINGLVPMTPSFIHSCIHQSLAYVPSFTILGYVVLTTENIVGVSQRQLFTCPSIQHKNSWTTKATHNRINTLHGSPTKCMCP